MKREDYETALEDKKETLAASRSSRTRFSIGSLQSEEIDSETWRGLNERKPILPILESTNCTKRVFVQDDTTDTRRVSSNARDLLPKIPRTKAEDRISRAERRPTPFMKWEKSSIIDWSHDVLLASISEGTDNQGDTGYSEKLNSNATGQCRDHKLLARRLETPANRINDVHYDCLQEATETFEEQIRIPVSNEKYRKRILHKGKSDSAICPLLRSEQHIAKNDSRPRSSLGPM